MQHRQISLIETGGTLSMGFNRESQLIPMYGIDHFLLACAIVYTSISEEQQERLLKRLTLYHVDHPEKDKKLKELIEEVITNITFEEPILSGLCAQYGIANLYQPYQIDSIDFSLSTHYPLLAETIQSVHQKGQHALVLGGTDTLDYYAHYYGLQHAKQDSPCKTIFISSMHPFGENPKHIAKLIHQARTLIQVEDIPAVSTLTAQDKTSEQFTLYDLQQPITKVSSRLTDAFKSPAPVGKIDDNRAYIPSSHDKTLYDVEYPDVTNPLAPPLMIYNNSAAIRCYLEAFPYHTVIIEGGTPHTHMAVIHEEDISHILALIKERNERNILTFFVNSILYHYEKEEFIESIDAKSWQESTFLSHAREAGALTPTMPINTLYLQLRPSHISAVKQTSYSSTAKAPMGLYYVPDPVAFEHALEVAKNHASDIYIATLPSGGVASCHAKTLEALHKKGHTIYSGFTYNGQRYIDEDGEFIESTAYDPAYLPSIACAPFFTPLGEMSPQEALKHQHQRDTAI